MATVPTALVPNFIQQLAPGGKYFRYARIAAIGLGVLLTILIAALLFPQLRNRIQESPAGPQKVTCTPRVNPLPEGLQAWEFSHGDEVVGPKIQTATIDTLTPPQGSSQTLTLTVKNNSPVTKVEATLYTDSGGQIYPLELTKGTNVDGTWVGILRANDSYDCVYFIAFLLESENGSWTGNLMFR